MRTCLYFNQMPKKCECGKGRAYLGLEINKPLWCKNCESKDPNARTVWKYTLCACGERSPRFGLESDKAKKWCYTCPTKPDNAVNLVSKRCECKAAIPSLGLEKGVALWCVRCPNKDPNAKDVVHKRCKCGLAIASIGVEGGRPLYCKDCPEKPANAKNVRGKRCQCGSKLPSFGLADGKLLWCRDCPDKPAEATFITKRCVSDWCDTVPSNPIYRGYCVRCFAHLFPEEPVSRNFKTKERLVMTAVQELLNAKYPHYSKEVRYDSIIDNGCSLRRPDAFVDALTHVVIAEVDEDGHSSDAYCNCEDKRLMMIMQDVGLRPMVVIRLNPDSYKTGNLRKPSCFKRGTDGRILIANEKEWSKRLDVFLERFRFHLDNIPTMELTVEHLYYDGFV